MFLITVLQFLGFTLLGQIVKFVTDFLFDLKIKISRGRSEVLGQSWGPR